MTTLSEDQIKQQFPAYAWLLNIPDVRNILADPQYQNNPEAAAQIQARIEGTNWWQTTEPSLRTYEQLQAQDPEGLAQQQRQKQADIWDQYVKLGLTPDGADVQNLAVQALQHNWNSSQLNDAIVTHSQYSPTITQQAGEIQTNVASLRQLANQYGLNYDDQTLWQMGRSIAAGEHALQDYTPQFQSAAAGKFPVWAPEILKGTTVQQLADPYKQDAAKLLEVSADSIDMFNDPKYLHALSYADPKTGQNRPMTLSEWSTYLRGTDQFKHETQQGQNQAAAMATGINQLFGGQAQSSIAQGFSGVNG